MATATAVDELIEYTLDEVEGVEELRDFDKLGVLADVADTPEDSFGDGYTKEYAANESDGLPEVSEDWGPSSATYAAFAIALQQEKRPAKIQIIKRAAAVARQKTLTFSAALQTNEDIEGIVNGVAVSVPWNTDSPTTLADLDTALSAIEGIGNVTVSSLVVTVVGTTEWDISVSLVCAGVPSPRTITVATSVAGHLASDDIAAALDQEELNDFFFVAPAQSHKGVNLVLASYCETAKRPLRIKTNESATKTSGGTTSTGSRLAALAYKFTGLIWHHIMTEHANVAIAAYELGCEPGQFQAEHRKLGGVTPTPKSSLSTSEVAVLKARNVMSYRKIGKQGMVKPGVRCDGKPLEKTRDLEWAVSECVETAYAHLTQGDKSDYDADGAASLESKELDTVKRIADQGVARKDKPASATITPLDSMDPSDNTEGIFEVSIEFYYRRGAGKIRLNIKSIG